MRRNKNNVNCSWLNAGMVDAICFVKRNLKILESN